MGLAQLRAEVRRNKNKSKAALLQRFFKTGPGEYAEGDIFLGITVPVLRILAKRHACLTLKETLQLLRSKFHEERFLALLILMDRYRRADLRGKEQIYKAYLSHSKFINNWDLVDVSAKHITGAFLLDKKKDPLYRLAKSESVWERRIAVLSAFHFIARGRFDEALKIAAILLSDRHDLIHKAAGWMLREIGKKNLACEEKFLKEHCRMMPRTMLRYAVERFPPSQRRIYMRQA